MNCKHTRLTTIGECMVEVAANGKGGFDQRFAGDTFNVAWYARKVLPTAWPVRYYTAVGDDPLSSRMVSFIQSHGIETDHIRRISGKSVGLYMIDLNEGERSFSYWRDTSAAKALADDIPALEGAIETSSVVMFSGITLAILSPSSRENFLAVLSAARARGTTIVFDSNFRHRLWPSLEEARKSMMAAAHVTSIALPSQEDETMLFGDVDADAIADRYLSAGVIEMVIKAGARSALVVSSDGRSWISPERQEFPIDTTGAGDSFNGSYIAHRLLDHSPEAAAVCAHATASRVVRSHGALV
jgi:2-dehydro-3-deoxygluconokinase